MRGWLSVPLILLFAPGYSGVPKLPLLGPDAEIRADPVTLDIDDPARSRVGELVWLGGVKLDSPDPAFGGFSAMQIDGDRFTLVSDGGNIVRFRMGSDWRIRDAHFSNLPAGPATGWRKADRDSESFALDPETGQAWLGIERSNAIWRYDPDFTRADGHAEPPAMAKWSENGGPEAMVRLRNGVFVLLSEADGPKGKPERFGLVFAKDPTIDSRPAFAFTYVPPKGFQPTDMAELPDGRLLVLNRRGVPFEGFTAKLTLVAREAIRPGARVAGREIAAFAGPVAHDNFEALAVSEEGGKPIVWIASDDNGNWFQRSLLLKFRLEN